MIARYCLVATFVCVWVLPLSCETHSKDAKNSSATKTTSKYDFRTQQCSREKSKFVREYFARVRYVCQDSLRLKTVCNMFNDLFK